MIEVSAKWCPKVIRKYITPTYYNEDIDSILDCAQYSNFLYQTNISWNKGAIRDDISIFDAACHTDKLNENLSVDELIDTVTRDAAKAIVIKYWDCFVKERENCVIGYEFVIDTGGAKPVLFRKPS